MSIPKNLHSLIEKLSEKTIQKKINWIPTSRETEYQCSFKESAITTDAWTSTVGGKAVDFAVYNKDGGVIERISFSENELEYQFLKDFHNLVQRSFYKTDETFNSLFNELDNL